MAAKIKENSPTKLTPTERLARKRAAARLRQQRCRARKRQAMLEQRREDLDVPRGGSGQDSRSDIMQDGSPFVPPRPTERLSPPSEPIYTCVSFDSQRSYEDAHRVAQVTPPRESRLSSQILVPKEPTFPKSSSQVDEDKEQEPSGALVAEEEAAIAAMLSLKGGSAVATPPRKAVPKAAPVVSRPETPSKVSPRSAKFRYYRSWEPPRHYEYFGYGRPYYNMATPPRPPPHFRGYYPAYKGYPRYEFD
eukprot:Nitzschia sp. Nitz4//scaffold33_size148984//87550//88296//NITZ4_002935-RA/size148984-processed-gene-0.172-mRNA-1//-1//CDS//3329548448//2123//frame0